jgi:Pao retrotransposon peptidase
MFLQQIWRSGIGWDDEIGSHIFENWRQWLRELNEIEKPVHPKMGRWNGLNIMKNPSLIQE